MAQPELIYIWRKHVVPPLERLEDFRLPSYLIKSLNKNGLRQLTALQKAAGPTILNQEDVVIVAENNRANTKEERMMSYLLPMFRILIANSSSHKLVGNTGLHKDDDKMKGPSVLILTASAVSASKLETQLQTLLEGKIHATYVEDAKGVGHIGDIMISDITSISQMMDDSKTGRIILGGRLMFLIFEESDLYNQEQWDNLMEVTDVALNLQDNLQLAIVSAKWTARLEKFYLGLLKNRDVALFIDYLPEIIRFAKILWKVDFVEDETRLDRTREILHDKLSQNEIITISCSSMTQAQKIKEICTSSNYDAFILDGSPPQSDDNQVEANSSAQTSSINIVPDGRLGYISAINATYLLNFDSSKDQRFRLKLIWQCLPEVSKDGGIMRQALTVNYLMSGKETNFLPFYRFMKRLDLVEISPELDKIGNETRQKELEKKPLCHKIKLFGYCPQEETFTCPLRHKFGIQDCEIAPVAPCFGHIEIQIIECLNASVYKALLVRHYSNTSEGRILQKSYEEERLKREETINEHYEDEENCKIPVSVVLGGVYALKSNSGEKCKRVKIHEKICKTSLEDPNKLCILDEVLVQCIDTGIKEKTKASLLMELEPEFQNWPSYEVTVILGNICPAKSGYEYTRGQNSYAKRIVEEHNTFIAKVCISVGDTVWVNQMIALDDRKLLLRSKLIKSEKFKANESHLEYLASSLRNLGDAYLGFQQLKEPKPKQHLSGKCHKFGDRFDWAFISKPTDNDQSKAEIKVTYAHHPWLFYGKLQKYEDLLENVETELNKWIISSGLEGGFADSTYYESLAANSVVAVKDSREERWMRGLVQCVWMDGNFHKFDIFLVDSGEIIFDVNETEISPILTKFVEQIPFQCIAFSLSHIAPNENEKFWNESEINAFLDLLLPDDEFCRYLDITALDKRSQEEAVPCKYYDAVAVAYDDCDNEEEIGETLAKKGFAVSSKDISETMTTKNIDIAELGLDDTDEEDVETDDFDVFDTFDVNFDSPEATSMSSDQGDLFGDLIKATMENLEKFKITPTEIVKAEGSGIVAKEPNVTVEAKDGECQPKLTEEQELIRSINSDFRNPKVLWHQTSSEIILNIQLADLKDDFDLKIGNTGRFVLFKTNDSSNYGFFIKLFGTVKQETQRFISGQYVKVILQKKYTNSDSWPRILNDKLEKQKWLKKNLDYVDDEDEEKEEDCDDSFTPSGYHGNFGSLENDEDTDEDDEDYLFRVPDSETLQKDNGFILEDDFE